MTIQVPAISASLKHDHKFEKLQYIVKGFLSTYSEKTIIDEVQRVPEIFSYLQTHTDKQAVPGQYVLSGSRNFLMMQSITQSLAGRTALLKLMPFSYNELKAASILPDSIDEQIFTGGYPRIYDMHIPPEQFYRDYTDTYIERDVRMLENIGDLSLFIKFIKLCAGRIGQIPNITSLANNCGISATTAKRWLSVLETSYIVFFLQSDSHNFSKRLIKAPKLYFTDTGLACSLLEIKNPSQLVLHYLRGSLFENMIINRFRCNDFNTGMEPAYTFWRDKTGLEIDLIETGHTQDGHDSLHAFEIKSGATYSPDFFAGIRRWSEISNTPAEQCTVIYSGDKKLITKYGTLLPAGEM